MNRIVIIGCSGSGKSTFAKKLHTYIHHELIHLDVLFWKPGWKETPREEWQEIVKEAVKKESWIIDGNYHSTMDIRLSRADTVIFFDFSRILCLWNAIKRNFRGQLFNAKRVDMAEGCKEKFDREFFLWIWNFNKNIRPVTLEKINNVAHDMEVITFKNYREADTFLANIKNQTVSN